MLHLYDVHHSAMMMAIIQKRKLVGGFRMGHSQAEKQRNRERILSAAARQIRAQGLESLSVGTLMQSVNLTHGGFYGHFDSRSDLLAQALERALTEGEEAANAAISQRPRTFVAMVKSYLSRAHRASRSTGCAVAALVSDVGRADQQTRAVMEEHIERYIARLTAALGEGKEPEAIMAASAMIGAVALARVMTNERRADEILRTVRERLLADATGA
jgi:TetR/AcrR family transcriptional regulator, transcriptional repressor for nem operon